MRQSVAGPGGWHGPAARLDFCIMRAQRHGTRIDPVLRLVAGVTLSFFLLRALIPAGFMPDADALADGRLELVICTSMGEKTVHAADPGAPDGGDPETWAGADCPYHLSLSHAFFAPAADPIPAEFAVRAAHGLAAAAIALLPPALGPPLGQRAPPFFA